MKKDSKPTSYTLTDDAKDLLAKIAEQVVRSKTKTLEWLIRQEADKRGIKLKKTKPSK